MDDYTSYYQSLKFQDTGDDPFKAASIRRKCLAVSFLESAKEEENSATCFLLNDHLREYSKIVDDQSKDCVNNYADSVLALLSHTKSNNPKQWESKLNSQSILNLIKPPPCAKNGSSICPNSEITADNINILLKNREQNKMKRESTPQFPTKNTFFQPMAVQSKSGIFIPNQSVQSFPQAHNIKKTQTVLPTYSQAACHVNKPDVGNVKEKNCPFKTAKDELHLQNLKKYGSNKGQVSSDGNYNYSTTKRSLGAARKGGVFSKFRPPVKADSQEECYGGNEETQNDEVDERLKNIEPKMIELIRSEIMDNGTSITWDDIAGLEFAKATIQEIVVWPMLRPDIFTGLRRPPKGILLFGPPGTGKTLIGKCIASQSRSTFFSISASSLTSKWIGDGEKMVRALFAVARCHQPAVVFIDEIDSLLSQRSEQEHESSRRIKTEFLVQLDGAGTGDDDRILIIGATNRPQELDEAARRRLVKRLYIPLPDEAARVHLVENLLSRENHVLSLEQIQEIARLTDGYSGADMKNVCQEASLGPIRSIPPMYIQDIDPSQVRPLNVEDFKSALCRIKSSVSESDLQQYVSWDKQYGCGR